MAADANESVAGDVKIEQTWRVRWHTSSRTAINILPPVFVHTSDNRLCAVTFWEV